MMKIVIVSKNQVFQNISEELKHKMDAEFFLITQKKEFTIQNLTEINPDYIFIPHWSNIIPKAIHENFECILFHMTDLPYGRGGSPLQNLIVKGHDRTKLSAIRVEEGLDAGDVYLKEELLLCGTAEEIFIRASRLMTKMIQEIVQKKIEPVPQKGEPVIFKRRKPEDGDLNQLSSLEEVYDYIRMLDAEGYPNAYLENENFRIEFNRASLKSDHIKADVTIFKK